VLSVGESKEFTNIGECESEIESATDEAEATRLCPPVASVPRRRRAVRTKKTESLVVPERFGCHLRALGQLSDTKSQGLHGYLPIRT
jgi:hypothetical protein